ncbi:MAG TPA: hypothetical protein VEZ70_00720 [Allosphingosinicella sp.]|nr:hypothetical protein [Allosphingosinicella sp.]
MDAAYAYGYSSPIEATMRFLLPLFTMLGACTQVQSPTNAVVGETAGTSQVRDADMLATYVLADPPAGVPRPTFHTARMAGSLAEKDGCVGLSTGGSFLILAFAPTEAEWDQQRRVLVVGGSAFSLGQSVEVGGSASGGPAVKGLSPGVPERCRKHGIWYVAPGSLAASRQ